MRKFIRVLPILIFILSVVMLGAASTHPVFAQVQQKTKDNTKSSGTSGTSGTTDYVDQDFPDAMDAAKDEGKRDMNAVGHVASVNTTMYSDLIRRVMGPVQNVTTNSQDSAYLEQMYKESFAYGADRIVTYVYQNPPASTMAFVQDMGVSLGFMPKKVNAQGIGFSGLSQLLPMWKAFRNIAYLLLALYMIVIGFLIMFRKKIDPKTVITVQNALPNIVVTLLLITFSYAIVGVLIDFMYLLIMIAFSILSPIANKALGTDPTVFTSGTFWHVINMVFFGNSLPNNSGIAWEAFNDIAAFFGPWGVGIGEGVPSAVSILAAFISNPAAIAGAAAAPLLILLILALAFIIALVRLLFLLISAYIQIILSVLISPFQLLMGAAPGSKAFESWIKNLIANLSVFPITAIMLMVGTILVTADYKGTKLWGPPLLVPSGSGYMGGGMAGIIGLGMVFAIPSIAGSIKEALKAKPAVQAGPSAILGPLGSGAGQAMNYLYQISMVSHMIPQKEKK